jgi:hypothetical protein
MLLYIRIGQQFMLGDAILMAVYGFAPLFLCAAVCTFRLSAWLKAGICTAISGIMLYGANYVATTLFGRSSSSSYQVDFHNWEQCINGNIQLIVLLSLLLVSAAFLTIGFLRVKRRIDRAL